jgi:hypothetical protein
MSTRLAGLALLALTGGIAACSSTPAPRDPGEPVARFDPSADPYWQDPRWDKTFLDAVQAVVHDPVAATDTSTPGLHATVKFTFMDGSVEYPEIVTGTGNAGLDKLVLHQLDSAQLPKASGVDADKPHEFVLDVDVPTPFEAFQSSIYAAIDNQKVYPKDSLLRRVTGDISVDFDYLDGKVDNVLITQSGIDRDLSKASINAVTKATFPTTPPTYADKTLHMTVIFCYTMNMGSYDGQLIGNACTSQRNLIVVHGWIMHR